MTIYQIAFYVIGAVMLFSTLMAITRKIIVHAVLYLVVSFLGSALLFYLLGAPMLGAMEVIIYAGAIMVLFLFIVMMLTVQRPDQLFFSHRHVMAVSGIVVIYAFFNILMFINGTPESKQLIPIAEAPPIVFGQFMFTQHWLAIELVSLLLLIALVGALILGKNRAIKKTKQGGGK
jgi:NADH-quinone oxidoreductase subunit J